MDAALLPTAMANFDVKNYGDAKVASESVQLPTPSHAG